MTDRRRRAASSESTSREDNPFAPPPEGQPDQPWEPRRASDNGDSESGPGQGSGSGPDSGSGSGSGSDGDSEGKPSRWGSQWSSRQPGRQGGGFGGRPGNSGNGGPGGKNGNNGGNGNGGNGGSGGQRGMRWDPTDPLQRHARYALHAGIWGLFFALLSIPQVALLLGALSLYWGIHALRGNPAKSTSSSASRASRASRTGGRRLKGQSPRATAEDVSGANRNHEETADAAEPENKPQIPLAVTPAQAAKAKKTAAIGGIVTAGLTLALVGATFTFQSVYKDYYTCQEDSLTQSSRADCKDLLPERLRPFLENRT